MGSERRTYTQLYMFIFYSVPGTYIRCVENITHSRPAVRVELQCPLKQVDERAVCRTNTMRNRGSCLVNTVTRILVPLL